MSWVGRQLGRYQILEELGSGGMSIVYKGLDTALDREVAVKILHPHLSGKPESRKRLDREARAVAKLRHPNILEVFDVSPTEGHQAYIVTEYIRGSTLGEYLKTNTFAPPEVAAMVIHEIAVALQHAHELGVIHRDLKPENVMVRHDGVIKLMDFGIAKIIDKDDRMTMTGTLVGSPAHMAPEIIEGHDAGREADIFSLGTMLYLFATGKLPFAASNPTATLKRILDGAYEDPRQLAPGTSDELAAIIAQCLAKNPAERLSSAGTLKQKLADYLLTFGIEDPKAELARYFADADGYRAELTRKVIERRLEWATEALGNKKSARALSCLNIILALSPDNPEANALLAKISVAQRRKRKLKGLLRLVGIACTLALLTAAGWWSFEKLLVAKPAAPIGVAERSAGKSSVEMAQDPAKPAEIPSAAIASPSPHDGVPGESLDRTPEPGSASVPLQAPEASNAASPAVTGNPGGTAPPKALQAQNVIILIRPYGYVQVDGQKRSEQELQRHVLSLTPGAHRVRITCTYCEPSVETIHVSADEADSNVFHLGAQPSPTQLRVDYQPAEAVVKLGDETRTAAETQTNPFVVRWPKGPPHFRHPVQVEISHLEYLSETKTVELTPNGTHRLEGTLKVR